MDKSGVSKVSVSVRAVEARLRRKLARDYWRLCRCRADSRGYHDLGDWYVVDHTNTVKYSRFDLGDLEAYARELGVLREFERVEDES